MSPESTFCTVGEVLAPYAECVSVRPLGAAPQSARQLREVPRIVGVLLQAAYRLRTGVSVPSPVDGDHGVPWWWDHLADQARALRLAGFSAVLLPPVVKTSAGAS